jgi:iron complex transport system substrate-binding protein
MDPRVVGLPLAVEPRRSATGGESVIEVISEGKVKVYLKGNETNDNDFHFQLTDTASVAGKITESNDNSTRFWVYGKHDMQATIEERLPPTEDRPSVGLVSVNSNFEEATFYVYPVQAGNNHKQYRDIEMRGAFDDHIEGGYGQFDYEQLLEVDPDAIVFQYGFSHVSTEEFEARMETMHEDPVGGQLTAVQNDRLYRGGTSYQGPIVNLFQTEAAAQQFYPETFGEWRGLETLDDEDARLFDYERVADAVNGDL